METIDIEALTRIAGGTARFEGGGNGSSVSFFVVRNQPGQGADKHRHPYDETFVILDGDIEVIVDGEQRMLGSGTIAVVPARAWHEFKNRSDHVSLMVNIHPSPRIIQEDWTDDGA
jgi:quercetin dioxygenase-like cupin family protein